MPVYVMFTTLTDEGRKTIKDKPERVKEVNKEVEDMGVKILCQYALLGQYDFINILEAPSNECAEPSSHYPVGDPQWMVENETTKAI
ncbi:GYD domain-containing protein [Dehalococcoidia bacterium]|nr:GYD domain-containing protein [Dehalococcoidia bacterium]